MNVQRAVLKLKKAWHTLILKSKVSYSQAGEDIIIEYLFNSIGILKPSYIDIGANQPLIGNNTYLFYLKKSTGICIEPNLALISVLKNKRPNDIILNVGISTAKTSVADFFYFEKKYDSWNTFSKDDAILKSKETGISFKVMQVALDTLNNICEKYNLLSVNLLSIDVEGLDLEILKSIDFTKIRPEVICVETIPFTLFNTLEQNSNIETFMNTKDYVVYANTNLNTIFCKKDVFKK